MPTFKKCCIVYIGKVKVKEECSEQEITEPIAPPIEKVENIENIEHVEPIKNDVIEREPIIIEFDDYAKETEYTIVIDGIEYGVVIA